MELKEILDVSGLPMLQGIAGEIEALKYIYECRSCDFDANLLLGVSGILFRFFVPQNPKTINADSIHQYKELIDGPEPNRLIARFSGWAYTSYLQNSIQLYFKKAVDSIKKDIPAITRDNENPSMVNLIIGYAIDSINTSIRKLYMKNSSNQHNPIEVNIPTNPEISVLDKFQWLNFIGISEFKEEPKKAQQQKEINLAVKRASSNLKPHYLGEGYWVAGAASFAHLSYLFESAQTCEISRKLLNVIFEDYKELRERLCKFLEACEKYEFHNYEKFLADCEKLPAIAQNILELLAEFDKKQSFDVVRIMQELNLLKTSEYSLIEKLANV